MSDQMALYQWTGIIREHFGHLSKPQATVLALWSLGLVLTRSCALTAVSLLWATELGRKENTLRQRLREWYYDANAKAGTRRQTLVVESCFVPLLRWLLACWQGRQLALALDATSLDERFVVLAVSVLYRGCAIPVAWVVLPAAVPHAWKEEWLRLLSALGPAVPAALSVIVLTDRGLYARWLFEHIRALGWHPFLRVNAAGTFRPDGWHHFHRLDSFAAAPDSRWQGTGTAFQDKGRRLRCTLLAWRTAGHSEPWLILTDLAPEAADAGWYGLRCWIEHGFKQAKRGGWQWQRTRMTDPERAARLWLALAVATLWLLSVGGEADASLSASRLPAVRPPPQAGRQRPSSSPRLVSPFRRGLFLIWSALLNQKPLPLGRFLPEPWPVSLPNACGSAQSLPSLSEAQYAT